MKIYQHNNLAQQKYDMPQYLYTKVYHELFTKAGYNVKLINSLKTQLKSTDILLVDSFIFMRNINYYLQNRYIFIVINMEPLFVEKWLPLLKILNEADYVIDYSMKNMKILQENNINCAYAPPSYSYIYEKLYNNNLPKPPVSPPSKDIDVLFYGTYNARRKKIFDELGKHCNVVIKNSYSLREQDLLLQRTKIIVIVTHVANSEDFDFPRASYIIANNILVIHESIADCENIHNLRENIIISPYDKLVETTLDALKNRYNVETLKKQYDYYRTKWDMTYFIPNIRKLLEKEENKLITYNLQKIPHIYWINLKHAKERRLTLEKQLTKYNISNTRIEAVTPQTIETYCIVNKSYYKTPLNKRVQSCMASHLFAIKTFIEDKKNTDDVCCIVEDDLSFETVIYWKNNIQTYISNIPKKYNICKLCTVSLPEKSKEYIETYYHKPVEIGKFWNGTCIYIIKRQFAQQLINNYYDKKNNKFNLNKGICVADRLYHTHESKSFYYPLFVYRNVTSYIQARRKTDTRIKDAANIYMNKLISEPI